MDSATIGTIIISVFSALTVGLFSVIAFFLIGLSKRSIKNEELLQSLDKHMGILQVNLTETQKDTTEIIRQIQNEIMRMQKVQELLRARVHYVINKLTAIKVKLETQKGLGIQFAETDWKLPDSPHDLTDL